MRTVRLSDSLAQTILSFHYNAPDPSGTGLLSSPTGILRGGAKLAKKADERREGSANDFRTALGFSSC